MIKNGEEAAAGTNQWMRTVQTDNGLCLEG